MSKKIAILGTRGLPANYGGFETFADQISKRLVQQGFEVTVFCEASAAPQPNQFGEVNLKYAPARKLGPLTTIAYDLACLWQARKGFDVVYMLGYGASVFCFIPRLWGSDVWINMDGLEWKRRKWSAVASAYLHLMEALATRTPTRIIADARAIRSDLKERYSISRPCDVIPYGCTVLTEPPDIEPLSNRGLAAGEYYLVVCRFEPENHVAEMIDGFLLSGSNRALVLIGNDKAPTPYVADLLKRKDPRVRFIGPLYDRVQLQSLRYHCRAFFHGYSVGGTPLSLLEAMGCSNLIVAHENRFNREVLSEGALYFSTPDDLVRIIDNIDSKAINEKGLKEQTRFRALNFYNWNLITSTYATLLSASGSGTTAEIDVAPPASHPVR